MNKFISHIMSQMTLQEKIGQLNLITTGEALTGSVVNTDSAKKIQNGQVGGMLNVSGVSKVKEIQKIAVEQSRLGIPLMFGYDIIHGYKTIYPTPLALSCSWDTDIIQAAARMAAKEATADGINWNFSPMVDVTRDPRWGRVMEGAGEDPFLGSVIAKAMVEAYQGNDLSAPETMLATVKHMALYGAVEAGKEYNSVDMSRMRMFNDYMAPYKAAIDAGAASVMTSFNDVEGIPATGNKWLLTDLLRSEWGFSGLVVSDYTSVGEMINHGLGDLQDVSAQALNAGLDMDMVSEGFLTTLEKSLTEGKVDEQGINRACQRILEAKYKLGLFDDPYRYLDSERPKKDILSEENRQIARKAACHSCVLLKNNTQILPIKAKSKIALIGPLANDKYNMLGAWSPTGNTSHAVSVLEGVERAYGAKNVSYAKGANISDDHQLAANTSFFGPRIIIDKRSPQIMLEEAIKISVKSDAIVAVIGEASEMSGESAARTDLLIPESQKKLIRELAKINKPLVLVTMSGRPLALCEELELADAILHVWHLGVEAGNAIADVLSGKYNPSGKLTMTFPRNVGQVPIYHSICNTGRPQNDDHYVKYHSNYIDVENTPLFPFGFGLSYTSFEYSAIELSRNLMNSGETVIASVEVTNTGSFDGEEVVQLYLRDIVATVTRPLKKLSGFKKVFLKKGETKKVEFVINESLLKFYHPDLGFYAESGEFEVQVGPNAQQTLSTNFYLHIEGATGTIEEKTNMKLEEN